nr:hypothetical protein [uncultured bacterium]
MSIHEHFLITRKDKEKERK